MSIFKEMGTSGLIARVRIVDFDRRQLYVEFRNGNTTTLYSDDPEVFYEFEAGSVVLIRSEENRVELVPDELWPEESWVGVVRLKREDITVVADSRGQWRMLPTHDNAEYSEGNTVEARDSYGVVRVLAKNPIKYVDLPTVDDAVIAKFRVQKGDRPETFEDFGGLQDVVDRARELIEVSLKHKETLSEIGTRPIKGVLFTGLPGTGKTMLARIIANHTDSEFYEISGPEVFSKWYGQSEEILRRLFEDAAKQERGAIIFFDEIDSVAGQRRDESHEASRRVVAQLLALMDGFTPDNNVVVIAATNRPQDIDAALRRPGRFDWEIHFPLPDQRDRELILQSSARHLSTSDDLPYKWMSQNTAGWSGADLAAIWSEAGLLAAADGRSEIITEDFVGGFERVSAQRRRVAIVSGGDSS